MIRELKKSNKVLMKRVNEESKDTFKKVSELQKENQLMQKILTQIIKKGPQVTKDVKLKKLRMFFCR